MSIRKKVGIITMHRVQNVGSVLQAYALCEKIERLGADAEIIDYQYPNEYHARVRERLSTIKAIAFFFQRVKFFVLYRNSLQKNRFADFVKSKLRLSKYYSCREELYNAPPIYNLYMTGSDQVWNPDCMKDDGVFFLDFVNDVPKVSYASSFSTLVIPDSYKETYKKNLRQYRYIGVREEMAKQLVNTLASMESVTVCDPTLLLKREDYLSLASESKAKKPKKPYVLVYALSYAFNPYPQIEIVTKRIKEELQLEVVYLHANSVDHYHACRSITSAGPNEFLDLFLNASFVVTSSFHGTAFAINFEIPFISIIPSNNKNDSRIWSLLHILDLTDQSISVKQSLPSQLPLCLDFSQVRPRLEKYRKESEAFLESVLSIIK